MKLASFPVLTVACMVHNPIIRSSHIPSSQIGWTRRGPEIKRTFLKMCTDPFRSVLFALWAHGMWYVMWHVARVKRHVASRISRDMWHMTRGMSRGMWHMNVTWYVARGICYMTRRMCHVACDMWYVARVIWHMTRGMWLAPLPSPTSPHKILTPSVRPWFHLLPFCCLALFLLIYAPTAILLPLPTKSHPSICASIHQLISYHNPSGVVTIK